LILIVRLRTQHRALKPHRNSISPIVETMRPFAVAAAVRTLVSRVKNNAKSACLLVLFMVGFRVVNTDQLTGSQLEPIATRHSAAVRACPSSENQFRTRIMEFERVVRKGVQASTSLYRFCPCCGLILKDKKFSPFGASMSPDRMCPQCGSVERHRRVCTLFAGAAKYGLSTDSFLKPPNGFNHPFRLLSFGPHRQMEAEISSFPDVDHVGLDYFYPGYSYSNSTLHADVQDLKIPDGFADGIIILHVLEHVPDLPQAFSELSRVLRNESGWALVEVPCRSGISTKDCRLNTSEERHTCAGQHDHVWRFGCEDFALMLRQHFKSCDDISDSFAWVGANVLDNLKIEKMPLHLCRNF
jgi:hypothetical protein